MSGDFHLHCYLRLESQCSITSPLHLDLLSENVVYHGNYRSCRSPRLVQNYCLKESVSLIVNLHVKRLLQLLG